MCDEHRPVTYHKAVCLKVKADILEEHEDRCDLKPRKCGFTGCKFETGYIEEALRHLSDSHGLNIWRNFSRLSHAGVP